MAESLAAKSNQLIALACFSLSILCAFIGTAKHWPVLLVLSSICRKLSSTRNKTGRPASLPIDGVSVHLQPQNTGLCRGCQVTCHDETRSNGDFTIFWVTSQCHVQQAPPLQRPARGAVPLVAGGLLQAHARVVEPHTPFALLVVALHHLAIRLLRRNESSIRTANSRPASGNFEM